MTEIMGTTFSIMLTKGAYVVREPDAERVLEAISRTEPHVLVEADIVGDGLYFSPVRLVTAHVVSIIANTAPLEPPLLQRTKGERHFNQPAARRPSG